MGTFLTGLRVRGDPERDALEACRGWLDAHLRAGGLRLVTDGSSADRTIVLVPAAGWISVYDDAAEAPDDAVLAGFGRGLSRAAGGYAFSVVVHDSDVLLLTLYGRGDRLDRFDSDPAYFGGKKRRGPAEPHLAAWAPLLTDVAAMREVFDGKPLFAEASLEPLARAIGADPARLASGYRDVRASPLPAGAVVMAYRQDVPPLWEAAAPGGPRLRTDWDLAVAQLGARSPEPAGPAVVVALGAPVVVSLTARNTGGPGTGVEVRVHGGDGVVAWREVQVILGDPTQRNVRAAPLVDGRAVVADAPIPPGFGGFDLSASSPAAVHRAMAARAGATVHVNVKGEAIAVGSAPVSVEVHPIAASEHGARGGATVVVRSTEGRPLRAPPAISPLALEPLASRAVLVGLVLLEAEVASWHASAICAALAPYVPQTGRVSTVAYPASSGGLLGGLVGMMKGPKNGSAKAAGYLGSASFRKLMGAVGAQVDAEWVEDVDGPVPSVYDARISFGRGILPSPNAVWALSVGLAVGDLDGAEAQVRSAIDTVFGLGGVIQALLVRWGQHVGLESTPYEIVCGVHGQCTLERAWAERWLRGVGPGVVWLGPALGAHVGSPEGLRIEVTDVGATELRLQDLLPSAEDWQRGVARRYGR